MKTDSLFHRIFLEYPALAFELAGLPPPEEERYRQESVEVKQTSFRTDGILRPVDPADELWFWEAQLFPDEAFYPRWFTSIFLLLYQQPWAHWRGLVIYPDRATERLPPPSHAFVLEHGPIHRVYLTDLLELREPTWIQRFLRLIVAGDAQARHEARLLVDTIDQRPARLAETQVLELLETLLTYKLPELGYQEILAMISIPNTRLQDTQFYKDVVKIGRQEGRTEGRQEGKRDEAMAMIQRQLKRRYGPCSDSYQARIAALAVEQLEQLGEDLLDFKDLTDLDRWLDAMHSR